MKKAILFFSLLALSFTTQAQTSTVRLKDGTYISLIPSSDTVAATKIGANFKTPDGTLYPIWKSQKGKYFIIRVSKKTGTSYKQYLNIQP